MKLQHFPERYVGVRPTTKEFLDKHQIPDIGKKLSLETGAPLSLMFSLKPNMSLVRDQGKGETCTSFGVTAGLEYVKGLIDLSEANLADAASRRFHNCNSLQGLSIAEAMTICKEKGIVVETDWPYDPDKICWFPEVNVNGKVHYTFNEIFSIFNRPTKDVFANMRASRSILDTSMPSDFVSATKNTLFTRHLPVILDVPVWYTQDKKFDAGWETGTVHMPTPLHLERWLEDCARPDSESSGDPSGITGWHTLPICAWDDTTGRFEFKNSWGTRWGNNGYGTIPYEYITQYSRTGMVGA
jgi:hypothetical protein